MLIKDKRAPTGQPIDAYLPYILAYNGAGPAAAAYAARVLADAHAYQGADTIALAGCAAAAGTYINPFAGEAWALSRNDQGVDYDPLKVEPIRAIGAGTIVDVGSRGSYGPWFDYKLADGESPGSASTSPSTSGASCRQERASTRVTRSPRRIRVLTGRSGGGPEHATRRRSPGRNAAARRRTTSIGAIARSCASCAAWAR